MVALYETVTMNTQWSMSLIHYIIISDYEKQSVNATTMAKCLNSHSWVLLFVVLANPMAKLFYPILYKRLQLLLSAIANQKGNENTVVLQRSTYDTTIATKKILNSYNTGNKMNCQIHNYASMYGWLIKATALCDI